MSKQLQKEIIQNIETLRKKSGLSQSELGKKVGWNQKQISRLERGERKDLDYESTSLLARALGVDIKTINPSFSNTNGKKENTVSKLIEELNSMIPNEIPVFLQRDCGNTNSDIVYYEYSANIRSQIDLVNNSPFPAGEKGEYFGMICELDYNLPAFSASDVLIADKNLNPIDPVFNTGNFVPNKWELYDRVIIKLNAPINNFYRGTTLKFFTRKIKKIKKINIFTNSLNNYDEIIVIGSGKGVVSVNSIEKTFWKRRSLENYRILSKIYQQAVTNCPRYNG